MHVAGCKEDEDGEAAAAEDAADGEDADDEDEEENVSNLREEASMPIEKVMEKYQGHHLALAVKGGEGQLLPGSPYLRARRCQEDAGPSAAGCSASSSSSGCVSSSGGAAQQHVSSSAADVAPRPALHAGKYITCPLSNQLLSLHSV